jgi:hypothetical protein
MAKSTKLATIAAGQWLSGSVDLSVSTVAMVIAPPQWTSANLTFQVSGDGSNWADLFDANGAEIVKPIAAGVAVIVDTSMTSSAMYLRLRSGPRSAPVAQERDSVFTLVCI